MNTTYIYDYIELFKQVTYTIQSTLPVVVTGQYNLVTTLKQVVTRL